MNLAYPLEIIDVNKKFGSTTALDSVSLAVEKGRIYGLLGPNGAGKTTLLRIINNLLELDSGAIKINGDQCSIKHCGKLGYMPEERGLYENMTVRDQIMFFGRLRGGDPARLNQTMNEYMRIFELGKDSGRKIKELSKGNQQKVQIVATLVHEPEIVMLDEPFSGFDPINGALLKELLSLLKERGTTVIISSHNMPAVEELCSHIAFINHGQLILSGDIDTIKQANKEGVFNITLKYPVEESLESESLLRQISASVEGYNYIVKKNDSESNLQLINRLVKNNNEIISFGEKLPTLNELFIKYAKQ